jgi:hypothetical protein
MPTPTVPCPGMGQDLKNRLAAEQTTRAAKAAARAAIEAAERCWMADDQLDGLDDDGLAAEARLRHFDPGDPPAPRKQLIRALKAARTKE